MTTPANVCGYNIEHYTHEAGWKPCTAPVPTLAEAQAQLAKLGCENHRVYWAIIKDNE